MLVFARKEPEIFGIAMLDIFCSALGAVLILLILTLQKSGETEADLSSASQIITSQGEEINQQSQTIASQSEELTEQSQTITSQGEEINQQSQTITSQGEEINQQSQTITSQGEEINQQSQTIAELEQQMLGSQESLESISMGNCDVTVGQVQIEVWDHGQIDGDVINVRHNRRSIHRRLSLRADHERTSLSIDEGISLVIVEAVNEGTSSPNTAMIRVDPCQNNQAREFEWQMNTGEQQFVSIRRQTPPTP